MSQLPRIECNIIFSSDDVKIGEFANAFRIVADTEEEVFVDFCVYSASENVARIVSRLRVRKDFLPLMGIRIQEAVDESVPSRRLIPAKAVMSAGLQVMQGLLVNDEGRVIVLDAHADDDN